MIATGVHQVDNPLIGADGNVYATYSGTRGQEATVSIFRITPSGAREPFVHGLVNPTSMAIGPDGMLHVSSRFEGRVYRVLEDGSYEVMASDLGVACGLAFGADAAFHLAMAPDGWLYVSAPTLASYDALRRIGPDGHVETLQAPFGRPQGLAFDRGGVLHVVEALAGSSGVYALRPGLEPELVVAGAGLVGVAFGDRGEMVVASSDSIFSFLPPT